MANQSSTPFDQGLFLVHLNRGREHFDRRNFIDAAEQLEEARRLRPDDDRTQPLHVGGRPLLGAHERGRQTR